MVVDSFLRCCTSPILGDKESPVQGISGELLGPASGVFDRLATGFEDLDQPRLAQSPLATDRTMSTSSSSSKVGSHLLINRNVMAALAPTRLLPSRHGRVGLEERRGR